MIRIESAAGENVRGNSQPLTFEQAAEIVRSEPPVLRGSAPGLLLPGQPVKLAERDPSQPSLFLKRDVS
jgi:hypothetical protein